MDKQSVIAAFSAAGLANVAQQAAGLVRSSVRIKASAADENSIPAGASKLGGLPDLPAYFDWPERKGAPMSFIAQIHLDDLHGIDGAEGLPSAGLLWFFYDARQETYGSDPADRAGRQVFFADNPSVSQLKRRPAPAGLPGGALFKACAVQFENELTLPENPQAESPSLMFSPADQERYEAFYAAFPSRDARITAQHRLLGHPDTIQDDMRGQCQLIANGVTRSDDPRAADLLKDSNDWQLLLQVDSDDATGMRWANSGMLYFWIRRDDLKMRNFDQVWVVLQSE
ncbi:MAG: YwqG family protein [Chloroflexi bacterium]|nr:YwqG family protein [Chloroflexota bacterium]MCL5273634.1 YwqG family protein [Chloroflexota bacterium]